MPGPWRVWRDRPGDVNVVCVVSRAAGPGDRRPPRDRRAAGLGRRVARRDHRAAREHRDRAQRPRGRSVPRVSGLGRAVVWGAGGLDDPPVHAWMAWTLIHRSTRACSDGSVCRSGRSADRSARLSLRPSRCFCRAVVLTVGWVGRAAPLRCALFLQARVRRRHQRDQSPLRAAAARAGRRRD